MTPQLPTGVLYDDIGLLKPDVANVEAVLSKIATSLQDARRIIDRERAVGRHILYLPGSYDLVHVGHALHIAQAVACYLSLPGNDALTVENLCVVTLADDDDLISRTKSYKFVDNGGTEPFRRPVQSAVEYTGSRNVVHWRLFELASVPQVHIAGFIPSPLRVASLATPEMLTPQCEAGELVALLAQFATASNMADSDRRILEEAIWQYRALVRILRVGPEKAADALRNPIYPINPWFIQSWQLFVHCYLASGNYNAPITRMISHLDDSHGEQIRFLMLAAGIRTQYLHAPELMTTSSLLAAHGAPALLDAKRLHYR